jgi:hypothetical protein
MSDRFEEAATKRYSEIKAITPLADLQRCGCKPCIEELATDFRWYHDKYLAEALTAAAMMKLHEEKTCEWRYDEDAEEFVSSCGAGGTCDDMPDYKGSGPCFCKWCGRRIKEAK